MKRESVTISKFFLEYNRLYVLCSLSGLQIEPIMNDRNVDMMSNQIHIVTSTVLY
jgi:hypothetical protein